MAISRRSIKRLAPFALGIALVTLFATSTPRAHPTGVLSRGVSNVESPTNACTPKHPSTWPALPQPGGEFNQVMHLISRAEFDAMRPWQQTLMSQIAVSTYEAWKAGRLQEQPAICLAPGTSQAVATALANAGANPQFFFTGGSWTTTATDGPTGTNGIANTLTFSFLPDGTNIPSFSPATGAAAPSALIGMLDTIYPSMAATIQTRPWFLFFQGAGDAIFDRWSQLTGVRYIYEPNDDGAAFPTSPGVVGTRGDVRIGGRTIDGASGILAFNFFPDNGDMVIDTSDTGFYGNTANNSRRLRNVLAHEHGHGLGISHVCSVSHAFLMEPFINTSFDLMQEDDIRAANRQHGDRFEFPEGATDTSANARVAVAFVDPDGNGALEAPPIAETNLSIDRSADLDWWSLSSDVAGYEIDISVTPTGTTYDDDPQVAGSCPGAAISQTNALQQSDLSWTLYESDAATVIASSDAGGLGAAETATNIAVTGTGPWLLEIQGVEDATQMYTLNIAARRVSVEPPEVTCPEDVNEECAGSSGNTMDIDVDVVDALESSVTFTVAGVASGAATNLAAGGGTATLTHTFPLGASTVVATATNSGGESSSCEMTVTIFDDTPPVVTARVVRPFLLPLYGGLTPVGFGATAVDACDGNLPVTHEVWSNEPHGTAPFAPDILANQAAPASLRLRAERDITGGGRIYLVVAKASDASLNEGVDVAVVVVPASMTSSSIASILQQAAAAVIATKANAGVPPATFTQL